jgi:hypothetical protein
MEDRMKNLVFRRIVPVAALVFVVLAIGSCGSKMEGTYTQTAGGAISLDLRSGGKASLNLIGESYACTYKVKGDKLMLDCTPKGENIEFTIHDDGSLTGPGFFGVLKKSK